MADQFEAEEGQLEVTDGVVKLTPHEGLGLLPSEVKLSDADNVTVTRSVVRDVSRISVLVKGNERLAATVPNSKVKTTLKALLPVEEDTGGKNPVAARETRTTKPAETRA